jgi:hypothetical protein
VNDCCACVGGVWGGEGLCACAHCPSLSCALSLSLSTLRCAVRRSACRHAAAPHNPSACSTCPAPLFCPSNSHPSSPVPALLLHPFQGNLAPHKEVPLLLGASDTQGVGVPSDGLCGMLDEVRVWSRYRSAAQVEAHYTAAVFPPLRKARTSKEGTRERMPDALSTQVRALCCCCCWWCAVCAHYAVLLLLVLVVVLVLVLLLLLFRPALACARAAPLTLTPPRPRHLHPSPRGTAIVAPRTATPPSSPYLPHPRRRTWRSTCRWTRATA